MLKKSLLILGLLTIINSVYSSEAAKDSSSESFPIMFKSDGPGSFGRKPLECTVGKTFPFIEINDCGKIVTGKGNIYYAGTKVHAITEDPKSWILSPELAVVLEDDDVTSIRVQFSAE